MTNYSSKVSAWPRPACAHEFSSWRCTKCNAQYPVPTFPITIIAAISSNGVIGRDGSMPWRLPADLRFFKKTTMGGHLVMGRKTWDSIGRALPGRTTSVLTRNKSLEFAGAQVAHTIEEATYQGMGKDVFICGGAEVYAQALPLVDCMLLTSVCADVAGDTTFPHIDQSEWDKELLADHEADNKHAYPFEVIRAVRKT